jgi:hypothetical protein
MKSRVIPTNVHSAVDRVVGPVLILAPELFRLPRRSPEGIAPRAAGTAASVYSNLTDYERSLKDVIPMRLHLALDALSGAALAVVPWVTGARKRGVLHWLPHTLVGAGEVALALTTKTQPPRSKPGRAKRVYEFIRRK